MRCKFSVVLIILSLLFFSCRGVSQDNTGEVSVDVGNAARHVIQNYSHTSSSNDLEGMEGLEEYFNMMQYFLKISLSTTGTYSTSTEVNYVISFSDVLNASSEEALEEYYRQAFTTPITIDSIPVDSVIKVKAAISMGVTVDRAALRNFLLEQGSPPEYIDDIIKQMNFEEEEELVAEGISDELTIQSGINNVKIIIKDFLSEDDEADDNGGSSQEEDDSSVNVILYNNVNGSTESTDHTIYSFDMEFTNTNMTATNANVLAALYEYTLLDYVKDGTGNFHYLVRDSSNEDYIKTVKPDNTTSTDHVAGNSKSKHDTKLAIDPATGIFFYGGMNGYYFYIDTFPKYTGSDNGFNMSDIYNDYSKLLDFTVSLGEPSVVTNDGTTTTTYSNAVAYIAMLRDSNYEPHHYDVFFIENPFTYTITDDGTNVTTAFNMSSPTTPAVYLSQTSFTFPCDDYFGSAYSVNDMIVHNGYLYALVSNTDNTGPYDDSSDDNFDYPLYSYGAIVRIKLDDFSISGVTIYGYDDSNCTNFDGIPATASKTINFQAYQPASVNAPYFFGPRKFVAIKPKELIIADDGYFYYMDGSDFCHKNVDRLVVFNEDENELKAYLLNTSDVIKFDNHSDSDVNLVIIGTGGSPRNWSDEIYATCKYRQ